MPFFLAGASVALFKEYLLFRWYWVAVAAGLVLLSERIPYSQAVLMPTAFVYLIFWFGDVGWSRLNNFGKYGDFSYGTYLYAFPIQQLSILWLGDRASPFLVLAISLPLSLVAGVVSWHMIEKPCLKLLANSTRVAQTAAAPENIDAAAGRTPEAEMVS